MPVKERPILFKPNMVKAILENRKTKTRRPLRVQPLDIMPMKVPDEWATLRTRDPNHGDIIRCRFGVPGDRLWVRETWRLVGGRADPTHRFSIQYKAGGFKECDPDDYDQWPGICYPGNIEPVEENGVDLWPWKPSIHMPRWASRLTVEVTGVKVERLQAITDEEICLELGSPLNWEGEGPEPYQRDLRGSFAFLWDTINGKRVPWASNPWVWCLSFKKWSPT